MYQIDSHDLKTEMRMQQGDENIALSIKLNSCAILLFVVYFVCNITKSVGKHWIPFGSLT